MSLSGSPLHGLLHFQPILCCIGPIWRNNFTSSSTLACVRWSWQIWPALGRVTMNRLLASSRGLEMLRTGAIVWFYLLYKDSCYTSRKSMLPKSSTASVRWLTGWHGRSNLMSRRGVTFKRKLILLIVHIPLFLMITRWWDRLGGSRTTRSRSHAQLATKNLKNLGSTLPRMTRSSIYCCQRDRLWWSHITRSLQIKS